MIGEIKEVPITTNERRAVLSLTLDQLKIIHIAVGSTDVNKYGKRVKRPQDCYDIHADLASLVDAWPKEEE